MARLAFDLSNFKSEVRSPARNNRYHVVFQPPPIMFTFPDTSRWRESSAHSTKLSFYTPIVQFPTTELKTGLSARRLGTGLRERFPTSVEFRDLMIDFIQDNDGQNLTYFHEWLKGIINYQDTPYPNANFRYKDEYAAQIEVHVMDEFNKIHTSHHFVDAYPILITGQNYQWADVDTPMNFTVGFDFFKQITTRAT